MSMSGYSLWKTLVVVNAFHEQIQYNMQFFLCECLVLLYRRFFYSCYINACLNSIFQTVVVFIFIN